MDHEINAKFKAGAIGSIGQDRLTREMGARIALDVERYISSMADAIKNVPLSTDQARNEAAKIFAAINAYAATKISIVEELKSDMTKFAEASAKAKMVKSEGSTPMDENKKPAEHTEIDAATASQEADNATELPAGEPDEAVKLPSVGDVENAGGTGD